MFFSQKMFDVQHICKLILYRLSHFNGNEFLFILFQREGRTTNFHVVAHRNNYGTGVSEFVGQICVFLIKFYWNTATSICWYFLWLLLS